MENSKTKRIYVRINEHEKNTLRELSKKLNFSNDSELIRFWIREAEQKHLKK